METYNITVHVVPHSPNWWTPLGDDVAYASDNGKVRTYSNGRDYVHSLTLTAPQDLGQFDVYVTGNTDNQALDFIGWGPTHVEASTYEWSTAKWGPSLPEFATTIPPSYASIGVRGLPNGTNITVDGNSTNVTVNSYLEIRLKAGTHVFEAPTTVPLADGARAVFTGWSDGTTANTRTMSVDGEGMRIIALYTTQFYLQVATNYGSVQGSEWCDANTDATFSVSTPGFFDSHILDHWEGNYVGNNPTGTIHMDGPKEVRAVYRTDYSRIITFALGVTAVFASVTVSAVKMAKRPKEKTKEKTETRSQQTQQQQTTKTRAEEAEGKHSQTTETETRTREAPKNVLVLRANRRAESDVNEDPNLKSISVVEAYVNSVDCCLVTYDTVKFHPTGGKMHVTIPVIIAGNGLTNGLGLFLAPTKDDPKAQYTITSIKYIGLVPRDVRMQAALEPPLTTEIRILPPGRGYNGPSVDRRVFEEELRRLRAHYEAEVQQIRRRMEQMSRATESLDSIDPYTLIGVPRTATRDEVKTAKRKLELIYHPDRSRNPDSGRVFIAIEQAYERILNDHPDWSG